MALPADVRTVNIQLSVPRFRCANPVCRRRVFAERFPQLVRPHARHTERLESLLTRIGVLLGSAARPAPGFRRTSVPPSPRTRFCACLTAWNSCLQLTSVWSASTIGPGARVCDAERVLAGLLVPALPVQDTAPVEAVPDALQPKGRKTRKDAEQRQQQQRRQALYISEIITTSMLPASKGFTRLVPSLVVVAGYASAFFLLSLALGTVAVDVAYAIWAGRGVAPVTIIAWVVYGKKLDFAALAGIALIVTGVVVLNLFSNFQDSEPLDQLVMAGAALGNGIGCENPGNHHGFDSWTRECPCTNEV
ncbi:MAG: multidrug efflux SMR transporter [Firmicutes bacterium]|nr:multidrug efflux SMR transporter [Bacillota bacterium]